VDSKQTKEENKKGVLDPLFALQAAAKAFEDAFVLVGQAPSFVGGAAFRPLNGSTALTEQIACQAWPAFGCYQSHS
jgi:hypothetical protein